MTLAGHHFLEVYLINRRTNTGNVIQILYCSFFSRAADLNKDGAIDLEEFKLMLGMD
jgi:hypothetical protein